MEWSDKRLCDTVTMNSLYTSGVRQTNSLQADLDRLRNGDSSASLLGAFPPFPCSPSLSNAILGQISASFAAMHRTIDDYDSMAKREIIKAKQEKAQMLATCVLLSTLISNPWFTGEFRNSELITLNYGINLIHWSRKLLLRLVVFFESLLPYFSFITQKAASQRADLVSSSATLTSPSDARRRFQTTHPQQSTLHPDLRPQSEEHSESPFRAATPHGGFSSRERGALDEHSFLQSADNRLDEFISQGREVLDNLVDQRNMLKGTHKRLLDAAHTMGMSRNVIGWIERRRSVLCIPLSILFDLTALSVRRICTSSLVAQLSRFSAFI